MIVSAAVDGLTLVIEFERDARRLACQCTSLETTSTELPSKAIQHFDIVGNVGGIVLRSDRNITQRFAINDILGMGVGKFRSRSEVSHSITTQTERNRKLT